METWFNTFTTSVFGLVFIPLSTIAFLSWAYSRLTLGVCDNSDSMRGKTVIVTGANSGIGKETTFDLAQRGAHVIMACRNIEASTRVKDMIVDATGNVEVIVMKLDLISLRSVRAFADEVNRNESRLDVLIHNAGVFNVFKNQRTEDGLGLTMATNYFGPFLLTHLLIDLLKRSGPSRVVVVASSAYRVATVRVDDLDPPDALPAYQYYSSKFANILFTRELARRLQGSGVTANCLHPGLIDSEIWRSVPFPFSWCVYVLCKVYAKTLKEGAQTTIHLTTSEKLKTVNGKYFSDCKEAKLSSEVQDMELALRLWNASEKIVGLTDADPRILSS